MKITATSSLLFLLFLFLLLLECRVEGAPGRRKCFQPTFLIGDLPGCAVDTQSASTVTAENKIICAYECGLRDACVSFNYFEELRLCAFFNGTPYRIWTIDNCTCYDVHRRGEQLEQQSIEIGENVAKYRRSFQSLTLISTTSVHWSWLALDNFYGIDWNKGECSTTGQPDNYNNWFMVDLVDLVLISYVRILSTITTINTAVRYKDLNIGVSNTSWLVKSPIRGTYPLCGVYMGPPPNATWMRVDCQPSIQPSGFVIVHQVPANSKGGGFMSLCEVQVYGALKYVYI